jgi:hypothetical protein
LETTLDFSAKWNLVIFPESTLPFSGGGKRGRMGVEEQGRRGERIAYIKRTRPPLS